MITILIVILIVLLIGALPTWPYSSGWGYYPGGLLGAILVIVLILALLVQLVIIEYPISGSQSRDFCHNLRDGLRRPVEWVRMLIPFTNELFNLGLEVLFRVKIRDAQAFALENAEPLLYLVHP